MAQEQFASVGPLAAGSATAIRTASSAPAGAIVLNGTLANAAGTVATMDNARRILFTFAADETGHSFVITGTLAGGGAATETVAGTTAGTVLSVLSYKTASFTISATSTGNVSLGTTSTNGAESNWIQFDGYAKGGVAAQISVSGTVNYTLQQTLDDPNRTDGYGRPVTSMTSVVWVNSADSNVVAATGTQQTNYAFPPRWVKILLNSGTGTVSGSFLQGG